MKKLLFTLLMLLTFSIGFAQKNVLVEELTEAIKEAYNG